MPTPTPLQNIGKVVRLIVNPKGLPLGAALIDTAKTTISAVRNKGKTDVR